MSVVSRALAGWALGATVVLGATLGSPGVAAARPAESGTTHGLGTASVTCPQVLFIGARGTNELGPGSPTWNGTGDGLGPEVQSFYSALVKDLAKQRSVQEMSVSYDPTNLKTLATDPATYFSNLGSGVDWTDTTLTLQAQECPHQQIVLAGYSQGAMIMHRVLRELGTAILSRVRAAVLIADGDQVPNDTDVTRYGTASPSAGGVGLSFPTLSLSSTTPFTASVGSKVLSVCNAGDAVCDDYPPPPVNITPAGFAIHTAYAGSQPVLDAALQAAQMVDAWKSVKMPLPANAEAGGGNAYLQSVACPAVNWCVAVGSYTDTSGTVQGLLLTGSGSSWTATKAPLPADATTKGEAFLTSVACPSITACVAVGDYNYQGNGVTDSLPLMVTGSGTSWTASKAPLPADALTGGLASLTSVACDSTTSCTAFGSYENNGYYDSLLMVTGIGTNWTPAGATISVGTPYITAAACGPTSSCVAAGDYESNGSTGPLIVTGSGASWTVTIPPLPSNADSTGANDLSSVACPSVTSCVLVGEYYSAGIPEGLLETSSGTSWNAAEAPLLNGATSDNLNAVACPSITSCVAVGELDGNGGLSGTEIVTGSGTSWTAVQPPLLPYNAASSAYSSLDSITCPSAAKCVAAGSYEMPSSYDGGFGQGLAVIGSGNSWTAAEMPLPASTRYSFQPVDVTSVACPSVSSCVAAGYSWASTFSGLIATGIP